MRRVEKHTAKQWVHVVAEAELVKRLDKMVAENGSDRSKFVRLLIRQEWERRQARAGSSESQGPNA